MNKKCKKTPRKKRKTVKGHKVRNIILSVVAVIVIAIGIGAYIAFTPRAVKETEILVPQHSTASSVMDSISKYLGNDFASRIKQLSVVTGDEVHPGRYVVAKGSTPIRVAWNISHGRQTPVKITINGIRTKDDLLTYLSGKMAFSRESLDSVLTDKELLTKYNLKPENAINIFHDNTYEAYWTTSAQDFVKMIAGYRNKFWKEERVNKASALGLSIADIEIVSSIVDEESNLATEKGKIGRLYINRLNKGMKLQADPTVKFAVGDFTIRRITGKLLTYDSPYNTYKYAGLPPGPIRTIREATIDSILNSQPSEYIFMCANPDFSGSHIFSKDFATHKTVANRYTEELDKRGIKN
jgi:UPF0755 protein